MATRTFEAPASVTLAAGENELLGAPAAAEKRIVLESAASNVNNLKLDVVISKKKAGVKTELLRIEWFVGYPWPTLPIVPLVATDESLVADVTGTVNTAPKVVTTYVKEIP